MSILDIFKQAMPGGGGGGGGGGQGTTAAGGFFGSGGTSNQAQTNTNTQNVQLTGGAGITSLGGGNIYSSTTDLGAISNAADISQHALDLGTTALNGGHDIAIAGLDNARSQLESSLLFGTDIIHGAFNFGTDITTKNYNALTDVTLGAFQFGQDALAANRGLVNSSLSGNAALAAQVSQSSQQSINDSLVKLAMIAAVGIAAVFIFKS